MLQGINIADLILLYQFSRRMQQSNPPDKTKDSINQLNETLATLLAEYSVIEPKIIFDALSDGRTFSSVEALCFGIVDSVTRPLMLAS